MVYFKTNFIKDSNVWVIRKVRPFVWGGFFVGFWYYFMMYEYVGRKVVLLRKLDPRSQKDIENDAIKKRSRWGYQPRFEPSLERSIKKRKYDNQTLEETVNDTPRIESNTDFYRRPTNYIKDFDMIESKKISDFYFAMLDHSRVPGAFDYTQPQTYHAVFPDVQSQAYVTLNSEKDHRKLQISRFASA